jgi:sugar phosphate isomerase/epimerase
MALKVGIQLYSVRNHMQENPYGTLRKVAELGYDYVEGANHNASVDDGFGFNAPAKQMKEVLDQNNLTLVGCHINPLDLNRLPRVLEYHQKVGNMQIGCDTEFFPLDDMDYLKRRCEEFNKIGELCRQFGMRYYYHNHYMEFQHFGDKTVFELIMENTDPNLVFIELDTYWCARGGQNPIDIINKYKDRLILLHQKDFPAISPQPLSMFDGPVNSKENITMQVFRDTKDPLCFVEIGQGILPIQDYIDAALDAPHLEYILLEQDFTKLNEMDSIKTSMSNFKKFVGIEF